MVRVGFVAGDGLRVAAGTKASTLPRSRRVNAQKAAALVPAVRREGLDGGLLAYDGQLIDDARLVVAVARTAAQNGGEFHRVAATSATGTSVQLTDQLTGETLEVQARTVINATGVGRGRRPRSLRPSRTHPYSTPQHSAIRLGADHSGSGEVSWFSSPCRNSWAGCIWGSRTRSRPGRYPMFRNRLRPRSTSCSTP